MVSGHRVTLTYKLYFDDDDGPAHPCGRLDLPQKPASSPAQVKAKERGFRTALETLLENPQFLPNGGMLGFRLRHVYQVDGGRRARSLPWSARGERRPPCTELFAG